MKKDGMLFGLATTLPLVNAGVRWELYLPNEVGGVNMQFFDQAFNPVSEESIRTAMLQGEGNPSRNGEAALHDALELLSALESMQQVEQE